ncbi:MAG: DUF3187 family protein [Brachybacterium paraconglomeratum]|nr:DUF3187 family protein [Brachybacterium paraconglomeratum]
MALGLSLAGPLAAQIDYRNLDDDRPVRTEDAYPVERYAFELILPYHFEAEADGASVHVTVPELAYGLFANAQVGVKAPVAAVTEAGETEIGLSGMRVFALYNFNTEGRWLPALSLRGDLSLPVGNLGGEATRFTLKAIATRSWGATRAHLNGAWSFGEDDEALAVAEPADRWSMSLAVDHALIRRSLLLIGEVAASEAVRGAPTEVNTAIGFRWQWTPTFVLDAGLQRRLRDDVGPDIGLTLGLSHAFALHGLMPSRSR